MKKLIGVTSTVVLGCICKAAAASQHTTWPKFLHNDARAWEACRRSTGYDMTVLWL